MRWYNSFRLISSAISLAVMGPFLRTVWIASCSFMVWTCFCLVFIAKYWYIMYFAVRGFPSAESLSVFQVGERPLSLVFMFEKLDKVAFQVLGVHLSTMYPGYQQVFGIIELPNQATAPVPCLFTSPEFEELVQAGLECSGRRASASFSDIDDFRVFDPMVFQFRDRKVGIFPLEKSSAAFFPEHGLGRRIPQDEINALGLGN